MALNIGLLSAEEDTPDEGTDTEETIGGEEKPKEGEEGGDDQTTIEETPTPEEGQEAGNEQTGDDASETDGNAEEPGEDDIPPEDKPRPEIGELSVDKVLKQSKDIEEAKELEDAKEDMGTQASLRQFGFVNDDPETSASNIAVELEAAHEAIEEALVTSDALVGIRTQMETALPYGGFDAPAMEAIQIAIKHMRARLGYSQTSTVSVEGYKDPVIKRASNVVAIESISTAIRSVWEAILNGLKKVMGWIKGFFGFFFKAKDVQAVRTAKVKESVKEMKDQFKTAGPENQKTVEDIIVAAETNTATHENDEVSKIVEAAIKKKKGKKSADEKLTEEEIQKALELKNKIREAAKPLHYGDFHLFRLDNKVLDAKGILQGIANTVNELEEDYKEYLDHAKFLSTIKTYEKIMDSLSSTEDRRALLGDLQLVKASHQSGNDVKKDEVPGEKELVRVSLTGYIGDYCISALTVKDPDDLLSVEKNLGKLRLEFIKDPDYDKVTLDNNTIIEKVRPDDLAGIQEYLDKLKNIYDKKLSESILSGIDAFEQKAVDISEKMKAEQNVDSETIQLALHLAAFVKNILSVYPTQVYSYLGRLQDHVNNYTRSLARKYFVISKHVAEL